jgi:hypothetical protein
MAAETYFGKPGAILRDWFGSRKVLVALKAWSVFYWRWVQFLHRDDRLGVDVL